MGYSCDVSPAKPGHIRIVLKDAPGKGAESRDIYAFLPSVRGFIAAVEDYDEYRLFVIDHYGANKDLWLMLDEHRITDEKMKQLVNGYKSSPSTLPPPETSQAIREFLAELSKKIDVKP